MAGIVSPFLPITKGDAVRPAGGYNDVMDHTLIVIKRLCQAGQVVFTAKAEAEMIRDGLRRADVIEAILHAESITKRLRSNNPLTGRRETLYVIDSTTWDGQSVYTKGKLSLQGEPARFYVLISSKRSVLP